MKLNEMHNKNEMQVDLKRKEILFIIDCILRMVSKISKLHVFILANIQLDQRKRM